MDFFIDLGTSYFRIGVSGSEEIINEPCVVAWDELGRVIVGTEAEQILGRNPYGVEVLHPIEDGSIKHFDAAVNVIKYAVTKFLPGRFPRRFNLTLSVPSGLTDVERRVFKEIGEQAGARQVKLFDSTVAAAIGADLPIGQPIGCLVVNLGAGVTQAAVMSMNGVVDKRFSKTGGRTVDTSIVEMLRKNYGFLIGLRSAEDLKLRYAEQLDVESFEARGRNLRTGLPDSILVPRTLIEQQLKTYYETIVNLVVETLETCPPELVGDIMDRGIVLVGGNAKMADILPSLTRRTEVPIVIAQSPETCVVRGLMQTNNGTAKSATWKSLFKTGDPSNTNSKGITQKG
ncbi:rod shape-determining protein [Alicyclobacillus dauci]|uniref:Rod shape-determining protein n=1 Tax=Alicyclobacillus dauci TaxID=1475485 RepID=A0ABY6Z2D1_9BACL|nr:rod shape-determining protein [Alicyclobacillus dauci]WAH36763.1 rod shape-determining protein [Alicyclobacillus dauci]